MSFALNEDYIKNNFKWDDERWIIIQIILELTIPTNNTYIFNKQSLNNSLKNINIIDFIPFYSPNSKYKQPEDEKNNIISYYKYVLGFGDNIPIDNNDNRKIILDDPTITKITGNIISKAIELKLINKI